MLLNENFLNLMDMPLTSFLFHDNPLDPAAGHILKPDVLSRNLQTLLPPRNDCHVEYGS